MLICILRQRHSFHAGATNQQVYILNSDCCFDDGSFSKAFLFFDAIAVLIIFIYSLVMPFSFSFVFASTSHEQVPQTLQETDTKFMSPLLFHCSIFCNADLFFSFSPFLPGSRLQRRLPCCCPAPRCCSQHQACCHPAPRCLCTTRSNCSSNSSSSNSSRHKWPWPRLV